MKLVNVCFGMCTILMIDTQATLRLNLTPNVTHAGSTLNNIQLIQLSSLGARPSAEIANNKLTHSILA